MTMTDSDYWLQRYATAIEKAVDAPGGRSRTAYLELARHYWSMHAMVSGLPYAPPPAEAGSRGDALLIRWAA
jgi:hypothetical protein